MEFTEAESNMNDLVGFSLCKFHLVHTLARVPVQECFAAEHSREVLCHTLEHLLDCSGIAGKGDSHLQALWWNVTDACLDIVWNPLDKIRRILVLHVQHLLID